MITLHDVTQSFHIILKWLFIGLAGIILFFTVGKTVYNFLFPKKADPPTVSYGKLPIIHFPTGKSPAPFQYSVDTPSGYLPAFPDRMIVYKLLPTPQPDLVALTNAQAALANTIFKGNPIQSNDPFYTWLSLLSPFQKLHLNVITYDYTVTSNYETDATVSAAINLPDNDHALATAQNFSGAITKFPVDDFDKTKTKYTYYTITNNTLTQIPRMYGAQIIRVDFFQNDLNNIPIYYPNPTYSTIHFLVAAGTYEPQVVEAQYFHRAIDTTDNTATYPIKTAQQAFDDLKKGKAYISYGGTRTNISIRNVSLVYYMGDDPNEQYAMPIILFTGDDNFYAYVSAVTDEWISN